MDDVSGAIDPDAQQRALALRREMRSVVIVHSLLYVGMVGMPAIALIWARNQSDRWLWITLGVASMSLLVVPVMPRWRWLALVVFFAIAFALRFTVLR